MSRTYDDLKDRGDKGFDPERDKPEPLDLFAYAASRQTVESAPEPISDPAVDPPPDGAPVAPQKSEEDVSGYEDTPLFQNANYPRRSLAGVIDPLAGVGRRRRWRMPRAMAVILLLAGMVVVVVALLLWKKDRARYSSDADAVEEALRIRSAESPPAVPAFVPPSVRREGKTLPRFEEAPLKISGAVVKTAGRVKVITFNQGLFAGGVRLAAHGRRALSSVAKQLSGYGERLSITVIGCTDNTPLNKGSPYADNRALGLRRAEEAIRVLGAEGKIPRASFHSLSYGERWSPYPNKTRADRAKNRTVVLRISCRPAG